MDHANEVALALQKAGAEKLPTTAAAYLYQRMSRGVDLDRRDRFDHRDVHARRQELTDDDLAALGAQMAAVDLGCATGTCGLPSGE